MKIYRKQRNKIRIITYASLAILALLMVRVAYVVVFQGEELQAEAKELHERERQIKAPRGRIITSDGTVVADNKTVCTVSVIHSQLENPELVINVLSRELDMDETKVRKYVEKNSSMERIKSNVSKDVGDKIRNYELPGVKIDEDSRRVYPYNELASKIIGFTGADNQGILGLEVKYEDVLRGTDGSLNTVTDARGVELPNEERTIIDPVAGKDLYVSLDYNIQCYATQEARKTYFSTQAKNVSVIVMNPNNGEILALVNYPEYNLNDPYTDGTMEDMNRLWRNTVINDTYEPGSTFKIITATAGLQTHSVSLSDTITCTGKLHIADRFIKCAKTTGHGYQTFAESLQNSCNPAFITWGLRTGVENFTSYMKKLGLYEKTGIDVPGEAGSIIHKTENIKELDLAVMSFGQSFQVTPLQLLRAVSAVVNGGTLVTPHLGVKIIDNNGNISTLNYEEKNNIIDEEVSSTMRKLLKGVVEEGGGSNCKIEGYSIAGKTATSEKLPRGNGKYIASFIGIAPAEKPEVIAMCIIDEPVGVYYGGTIAAPVVRTIFENILPYLGVAKSS